MRISTNSIFEAATTQLGSLQTQLAKTQTQLATNRRILSPSDDPIASARALEVTQAQAINSQLTINRQSARSSLTQVEQALQGSTKLIQEMQAIRVAAGNGALSPTDRASFATELEGRLADLLGLANSADGAGGYLFSGYKSDNLPFTQTATGADYHGDQGQRQLKVGSSRHVAISDSGSSVFESNRTGNGTFNTSADVGNTGSGVIAPGAVSDTSLLTGHTYKLTFATGGTTYTVTDTTTNTPVPPPPAPVVPIPFQSGQAIVVDGMTFDITGTPADGDSFTVEPSKKQSIFTTVTDMIATLRADMPGALGQARLTNGLNTAGENLSAALDNVLTVQASVGSRLKELDYLDSAGEDMHIQYSATLSDLQDLDMVKAISSFSQQQLTLEAAQKSFKAMSGLSLFNLI
jgi:flagellar hook-associated protein 3 FlgL